MALKDCWIIGDLYISEIFHELLSKNRSNRLAKLDPLYVYANYNVKCYSSNPLSHKKEAPARLVNALVNAINDNTYLPRLIIVAPDWDIVRHIGEVSFGIFTIFEKLMKWVVNTMNRAVDTRKEDLRKFSEGATTCSEPKWLWVKMID